MEGAEPVAARGQVASIEDIERRLTSAIGADVKGFDGLLDDLAPSLQLLRQDCRDIEGEICLLSSEGRPIQPMLSASVADGNWLDIPPETPLTTTLIAQDSPSLTAEFWADSTKLLELCPDLTDVDAEMNIPENYEQFVEMLSDPSRFKRRIKKHVNPQLLVNYRDKDWEEFPGATLLHRAALADCVDTLTTLLESGADPEIRNSEGNTAVDVLLQLPEHSDQARRILEDRAERADTRVTTSDALLDLARAADPKVLAPSNRT